MSLTNYPQHYFTAKKQKRKIKRIFNSVSYLLCMNVQQKILLAYRSFHSTHSIKILRNWNDSKGNIAILNAGNCKKQWCNLCNFIIPPMTENANWKTIQYGKSDSEKTNGSNGAADTSCSGTNSWQCKHSRFTKSSLIFITLSDYLLWFSLI